MTAHEGCDELREDILDRIRTVIPDRHAAGEIRCSFGRQGQTLVVHLEGPGVSDRVRNAIAVRVLDAVWRSGRTHGQVDVSYHPSDRVPS